MRCLPVALFLVIAALPFAAMAWHGDETESLFIGGDTVLTITSPHSREVKKEYSRAFRRWMQIHHNQTVEIRWLDVGGTSKILKDLESRYKATPASAGIDLLFGGGVPAFLRADDRGWLVPVFVPPEILRGVPPTCAGLPVYDHAGHWYGVALSGFGIIFNKTLISQQGLPVPETWEDLAQPAYVTWVGSGDPRSSGSVHACYEIILQAHGYERGWGLITRLCANVRTFGEGGGAAPREVMAGDVAAGMVIDQYAQRTIAAMEEALAETGAPGLPASPLGFVLPQNVTVISPDPIGMLKGAPKPELARLFVAFVLSAEGQRLLYQPAGVNGQRHCLRRRPVRPALYAEEHAPASNPFTFGNDFRFDQAKAGMRRRVLADMIGKWCIDAHAEAQAAWQAIAAKGCPADLVTRFCDPPVPENQMLALASQWKQARLRQATLDAWSRAARQRYRTLEREALAWR